MPEPIHVRARKFLQEFFNDEDLTNFCFDYFPQVYNDFTQGMPKSQKVRMLVEKSQRRGRIEELLAALERERPKIYLDHFAEQPHLIDPEHQTHKTIERNPRQIFISYAHQDAEFAQRLEEDLQTNGWQTWMAPDSIRLGEKWVEAINRGLLESGIFVLIITPQSVDSRWVQTETNVAISMEHRGEIRLLPLMVKSTAMPPLWSDYQWIAISSEIDYEAGLVTLLNELNSPPTPPTKLLLPFKKSRSDSMQANRSCMFFLLFLLIIGGVAGATGWFFVWEEHSFDDLVYLAQNGSLPPTPMAAATPTSSLTRTLTPQPMAIVTSISTPIPLVVLTREQDGMPQVLIPATTFMMGARNEDKLAAMK